MLTQGNYFMKKFARKINVYILITFLLSMMAFESNAAEPPVLNPVERALIWEYSFSPYGDQLYFRSIATWDVNPDDVYKTLNFNPPRQRFENGMWINNDYHKADNVAIMPNNNSSQYPYDFVNLTSGDHIGVNLISEPVTAHLNPPPPGKIIIGYGWDFVTDISKAYSYLYTNDYSTWKIHKSDRKQMKQWQVNDHIIFGLNNDPSSNYPNIIINVKLKKHIRVSR